METERLKGSIRGPFLRGALNSCSGKAPFDKREWRNGSQSGQSTAGYTFCEHHETGSPVPSALSSLTETIQRLPGNRPRTKKKHPGDTVSYGFHRKDRKSLIFSKINIEHTARILFQNRVFRKKLCSIPALKSAGGHSSLNYFLLSYNCGPASFSEAQIPGTRHQAFSQQNQSNMAGCV